MLSLANCGLFHFSKWLSILVWDFLYTLTFPCGSFSLAILFTSLDIGVAMWYFILGPYS